MWGSNGAWRPTVRGLDSRDSMSELTTLQTGRIFAMCMQGLANSNKADWTLGQKSNVPGPSFEHHAGIALCRVNVGRVEGSRCRLWKRHQTAKSGNISFLRRARRGHVD
jgi:hypothetical protein